MKTAVARLGSQGQIVLPKEARDHLGLNPDDMVIIAIKDGVLQVTAKPKKYSDHIRGLGRDFWWELGGGEQFNRREKGSWE